MGNLFAELKRRHIYRVAAAYAVIPIVIMGVYLTIARRTGAFEAL